MRIEKLNISGQRPLNPKHGDKGQCWFERRSSEDKTLVDSEGAVVYKGPLHSSECHVTEVYCGNCGWVNQSGVLGFIFKDKCCPICKKDYS